MTRSATFRSISRCSSSVGALTIKCESVVDPPTVARAFLAAESVEQVLGTHFRVPRDPRPQGVSRYCRRHRCYAI